MPPTSPRSSDKPIQASASTLALSPAGHLRCQLSEGVLAERFATGEAEGLLSLLTLRQGDRAGDESTAYWLKVSEAFIRRLCHVPEGTGAEFSMAAPEPALLAAWVLDAPPMTGGEYLSPESLAAIWERLEACVRSQVDALGGIAAFLHEHAPQWSRVGRVTVHLAENKGDPDYPFAFMASYASGLSAAGRLRQVPLHKALDEYGGTGNKAVLLKLLEPLHRASQACPFMADLVESGDVYHPLAWSPQEAHSFLQSVPAYEEAGLLVRLPDWWRKRTRRPKVSASIGEKKKSKVGLDAMLDFKLEVVIDGQSLDAQEVESLLSGDDGLVLFRGQWVEVDREKLQEALDHWKELEAAGELSFAEGMRLLAGASENLAEADETEDEREWAFAQPGGWLADTLRQLTDPTADSSPPSGLQANLRPYQHKGLDWLWFCARTGLGACLADDMGLGKTIQVLAALQRKKETDPGGSPALLVVPASLIGNWQREAARFTPELRLFIAHRSQGDANFEDPSPKVLDEVDLVVTTYGMLTRLTWPVQRDWSWIIIDEAQAIKNHGTRQSKAVRKLRAQARIALTGTPVENHLGDLWSLFDFINPGLLGTQKQFGDFAKNLREKQGGHYAPLRRLVAPYILRRLKTDKTIITDLPDKTEMKVYCGLTTTQAKIYRQTAAQLEKELASSDGIQRRGLVLAYLMRFKQICNHPDQLTKSGDYAPAASAKFERLAEICEEIASRGEKALVFTQFRELAEPLEAHLSTVFGRGGLILHGGTPVKTRQGMVERFQRDDGPPFFVLSLKAGGTGLNLTAASHVIHFDRWWNPAVENQATDRAFRIGQQRNVLVHKFVTSGTLEEKIDSLITEKQETANAILDGAAEKVLTEMSNDELLNFIRLSL
ncbi:MAG: DEAD/DEAH box helicase [Opitutales bacterium]